VIESLTADGRDRSLDYKITGFNVPKGSPDAKMVTELAPTADEILFPKTSSSVFISTNIDYVLRNLGTRYLIIAGCLTDQCVDSAVRDACDLGYLVTVPTDACLTLSAERHEWSLRNNRGYCRQRTTQEVLDEIARLTGTDETSRQPTIRAR
jgi:ureidoacrylate peracid hydrolase